MTQRKVAELVRYVVGTVLVGVLVAAAIGAELTSNGNELWNQDSPGIEGTVEEWDQFGRAVAAGDFNGDEYANLAVGVPCR